MPKLPFGLTSKSHKVGDVALVKDITGTCLKCRHHCTARLVAYYGGQVIIRCNNCKAADQFDPDDKVWTSAATFAPFRSDADDPDAGKKDTSEGIEVDRKKGGKSG